MRNDWHQAIKDIQEVWDTLSLTKERHLSLGNALVTISDYIEMLEKALQEKQTASEALKGEGT